MNESKGITRATNARKFYQKRAFIVQMDCIKRIGRREAEVISILFVLNKLRDYDLPITSPLAPKTNYPFAELRTLWLPAFI